MNAWNLYEIGILDWIAEHLRCDFLDATLPWITKFADKGIGFILVAVLLLCFRKTRKAGCMMGVALLMGLLIGNLCLKPLVARIRPYDVNPAVVMLIEKLHDYSFPSGHTLAAFEFAGVLFFTYRKPWGWCALVFAVLIAFSRLYLYMHYPTDVLIGAVLGFLFAWFAVWLVNTLECAYRKKHPEKVKE